MHSHGQGYPGEQDIRTMMRPHDRILQEYNWQMTDSSAGQGHIFLRQEYHVQLQWQPVIVPDHSGV
jgi:hypothetical protein